MWINLRKCSVRKNLDTRVYTIWFHWYKIPEHTKLIYSERKEISDFLGVIVEKEWLKKLQGNIFEIIFILCILVAVVRYIFNYQKSTSSTFVMNIFYFMLYNTTCIIQFFCDCVCLLLFITGLIHPWKLFETLWPIHVSFVKNSLCFKVFSVFLGLLYVFQFIKFCYSYC